jgi:hypothetical protein
LSSKQIAYRLLIVGVEGNCGERTTRGLRRSLGAIQYMVGDDNVFKSVTSSSGPSKCRSHSTRSYQQHTHDNLPIIWRMRRCAEPTPNPSRRQRKTSPAQGPYGQPLVTVYPFDLRMVGRFLPPRLRPTMSP